jgi:hypothetical protein
VLLGTETDTERRENVLAARFRDTERESAGVGLTSLSACPVKNQQLPNANTLTQITSSETFFPLTNHEAYTNPTPVACMMLGSVNKD